MNKSYITSYRYSHSYNATSHQLKGSVIWCSSTKQRIQQKINGQMNYQLSTINFNELSIRALDTLLHFRLPGRVWYTWDWITELQHWHATWIILQSRDSVSRKPRCQFVSGSVSRIIQWHKSSHTARVVDDISKRISHKGVTFCNYNQSTIAILLASLFNEFTCDIMALKVFDHQ